MRRVFILASAMALSVLMAVPAGAAKATHQTADTYTFEEVPVDVGDAIAVRNDNGISVSATAYDADPGVYTMWWIVWNTPEECGTPYECTETDLEDPEVDLGIGYAGGAVVGPSGKLMVSAHLGEGATLTGFPTEFGLAPADSLWDSRHAEVHLVLRSHGEAVPGLVGDMLHTFLGGCDYTPEGLDGTQDAYGAEGPNTCSDTHFVIFASENA